MKHIVYFQESQQNTWMAFHHAILSRKQLDAAIQVKHSCSGKCKPLNLKRESGHIFDILKTNTISPFAHLVTTLASTIWAAKASKMLKCEMIHLFPSRSKTRFDHGLESWLEAQKQGVVRWVLWILMPCQTTDQTNASHWDGLATIMPIVMLLFRKPLSHDPLIRVIHLSIVVLDWVPQHLFSKKTLHGTSFAWYSHPLWEGTLFRLLPCWCWDSSYRCLVFCCCCLLAFRFARNMYYTEGERFIIFWNEKQVR